MEKKTDLIDIDQAKLVADRLNETNPLERLPSKGTISNWVCKGRLMKYGTQYLGPKRGRPKVLISQSDLIELLLNQPPMGRSVGWRKEKVKPALKDGRDNVEIGKLRAMLQELIQIIRSSELTKDELKKLRKAEEMLG